jgi:hypothetical protein
MKFCPQCDFIYENDQSLCDMDGAALVYDPKPFPPAGNAAPSPAVISSANSQWWRFTATAVVGVVLGTALLYQVSVHPTSPPSSSHSSAQVTNNSPEQVTGDSAAPISDDSEAPSNLDLTQPVPLTPPIEARPAPLSRKASPQTQSSEPSWSTQLPQLSKSTATANSGASAAVKLPPSSSRSAPKREEGKRKPVSANDNPKAAREKKDSSIGSFLKKTSRIFKKPFKL